MLNRTFLFSATCLMATTLLAQPPAGGPPQGAPPAGGAPGAQGAGRGGRGGGGRGIAALEETGFQPIFDGTTLNGWEGDPKFFRVENGAIVGQTTAESQPTQNTFLIWRGGTPADFELKMQYKLTGNNSGIQIRSIERPDFKTGMAGYQADMDGNQTYTGQFYEERGRGFLAMRGQFTYIGESGRAGLVSSLGSSDELKAIIKTDDWNDLHLIARGNVLIQMLNGRVTSVLIDDDPKGRRMEGLIGIQCHTGPPMKMEVRNIRLKKL